eukprot:g33739.t1
MNPNYPDYEFTPSIASHSWEKVLRGWAPAHACELIGHMLTYDPGARTPPLHVLLHPFFAELRSADKKEKEQCKNLFNFREDMSQSHPSRRCPEVAACGADSIDPQLGSNSVHFWDMESNSTSSFPTPTYGITKMCANAEKGLVAFCEGGAHPQVYVYSCSPYKLLFTLSDLAELELADMAFSHCGSRLYALSRATSKRLTIFSMKTGRLLPGCELQLPLRFDKVSVYPGHKDHLAVVRSSTVRMISITKPASIPSDVDLAVSAYCWTASGHFLVATRQGMLCTMDGATGALVYICQAEQPITSIILTQEYLVTSHIGNTLNFWELQPQALARSSPEEVQSFAAGLALAPQMALSTGMFQLKKVADLESVGTQRLAHRLLGQVASLQTTPDSKEAVLTTAEGEVWTIKLPSKKSALHEFDKQHQIAFLLQDDMYVRADQLQMELLCWFHPHTITSICPIGTGLQVCASADEGGRLRLWQVIRGEDPKGFKLLRFTSAVTSLTAEARGKFLLAGTDSGCIHAVAVDPWPEAQVIDSNRISEVGIAKLCSTSSEDGRPGGVAALLFDGRIAMVSFSLREPKVKMLGLVEHLGSVEDIYFHEQEKAEELNMPPKLLAVGCTKDEAWQKMRHPVGPLELTPLRTPKDSFEPRDMVIHREAMGFWSSKLNSDTVEGRPTAVCSISKSEAAVGFATGEVTIYATPTHVGLMVKSAATPVKSADGLLVWSEPGSEISVPADDSHLKAEEDETFGDETSAHFAFELDDTDVNAFPVWVPPAVAGADATKAAAKRKLMSHEIEALRKKLRILIDHNSNAPDLEKLERGEFCVDFEERALRRPPRRDRARERREAVDSRQAHQGVLGSDARQRVPDHLLDLKLGRVQLSRADGREQYMVNWWPGVHTKASEARAKQLAEVEAEVKRRAAQLGAKEDAEKQKEKDKGKDAKGEESGIKTIEETGSGTSADSIVAEEQKFLYEPFELVTNSRRRLQIHLLQSLSADYRMHFNELFKACQGDKKNIIDGIKEKCSRIHQILGELQIEEEVPEPTLQEVEDSDSVLKAREEAAAKEEERLRQLRENDAGQRALVQMMGGTLKTKKDLTPLEIVLDKEAWMDEIPEEDMTELQKAAFAEYQAKEKALAEAQEAYKKQLSAELKSLRAGVQELTLQFEGLLKRLHHERFAHDAKFLCQELYCARLQLALLQNVEDNLVREQAELDLEASKAKVLGCEQRVNDFTAEVQRVKGEQDDRARYEKEAAPQAFANSTLEANAITTLLQLFRKKREKDLNRARSFASETNEGARTARKSVSNLFSPKGAPSYTPFDVVADPYADLGAEPKAATDGQVEDDIRMEDCPEGVDEDRQVTKGATVLAEMGGFLAHLERESAEAKSDRDRLERELREHKDEHSRVDLMDSDLQSLLKGGEEGRNKAESDLLERKIEHVSEATEKKEQALKKQHAMLAHAAKLRLSANRCCGGGAPQKTGGGGRVEADEGAAKAARTAFKELRSRQRLMEAAKKNTEEIEILHKELDRLRQRTFPSFVQLHEDRSVNPDFR